MRIISGIFKNRDIEAPRGDKTRPTSSKLRESFFNIVQNDLENIRFLDLFAGSGAIGFESLSRGASFVQFVEREIAPYKCLMKNAETLGVVSQVSVNKQDVIQFLEKAHNTLPFDLVFMDPPYGLKIGNQFYISRVLELLNSKKWLQTTSRVFLEESSFFELSETILQGFRCLKTRKYGSSQLFELQCSC